MVRAQIFKNATFIDKGQNPFKTTGVKGNVTSGLPDKEN